MIVVNAERTLVEVRRVLDSCGVPFFLILGTCLGVVRDGRLIGFDTDVDIGCLIEDIRNEAERVVVEFAAAGFEAHIVSNPLTFPRAVVVKRDGIKVDIAGFLKHDGERYCPSSFLDYCLVYPAALVEETETVDYLGCTWRVPSPVQEYLARHYGPGWVNPDPKYRPIQGKARVYGYLKRVKP
jgi:hypothetical protein